MNRRFGSGFFSVIDVNLTSADGEEILKDILIQAGVLKAYSVEFLPSAPCEVSIDGRPYQGLKFLVLNPEDIDARSIRVKGNITYDLYVKY